MFVCLSICVGLNQSICQSINRLIDRSINLLIDLLIVCFTKTVRRSAFSSVVRRRCRRGCTRSATAIPLSTDLNLSTIRKTSKIRLPQSTITDRCYHSGEGGARPSRVWKRLHRPCTRIHTPFWYRGMGCPSLSRLKRIRYKSAHTLGWSEFLKIGPLIWQGNQ